MNKSDVYRNMLDMPSTIRLRSLILNEKRLKDNILQTNKVREN